MTLEEAERIVKAYGAAIVDMGKEGLAGRLSLLPCSKPRVRYAFYVYLEAAIRDNLLTKEHGEQLAITFSMLNAFIPDGDARAFNAIWNDLAKIEDRTSEHFKAQFRELGDTTRFLGEPSLLDEFDTFAADCMGELTEYRRT